VTDAILHSQIDGVIWYLHHVKSGIRSSINITSFPSTILTKKLSPFIFQSRQQNEMIEDRQNFLKGDLKIGLNTHHHLDPCPLLSRPPFLASSATVTSASRVSNTGVLNHILPLRRVSCSSASTKKKLERPESAQLAWRDAPQSSSRSAHGPDERTDTTRAGPAACRQARAESRGAARRAKVYTRRRRHDTTRHARGSTA
jgi:hypothetical protein